MIDQKNMEESVLYWTLIGRLKPDNRFKYLPGILTEHPPHLRKGDTSSPFRIDLLDESGRLLVTQKVPIAYYCPDKRHRIRDIPIRAKVPFNEGTKIIRFWNGEVLVKEWKRTKAKPVIEDLEVDKIQGRIHLRWKASHAEGAKMQYVVRYSRDGGRTFNRLSKRLEVPEYEVSENDLPGGKGWLFQVAATDGINTTTLESDPLDLPEIPPKVEISSPQDGEQIPAGKNIDFDGKLVAFLGDKTKISSVSWVSDRDGKLSDKLYFNTSHLSKGKHQITFSIDDSRKRRLANHIKVEVI